jgi:hypothetical protein
LYFGFLKDDDLSRFGYAESSWFFDEAFRMGIVAPGLFLQIPYFAADACILQVYANVL